MAVSPQVVARSAHAGDSTALTLTLLSDRGNRVARQYRLVYRVAAALRKMHGDTQRSWTVDDLACEAGMSRSAFFDRFTRTVGLRPMEYLLSWRMALAKELLRGGNMTMDEVARRVGYGSASTFSTAFSRHVGQPPGRFARASETSQAA